MKCLWIALFLFGVTTWAACLGHICHKYFINYCVSTTPTLVELESAQRAEIVARWELKGPDVYTKFTLVRLGDLEVLLMGDSYHGSLRVVSTRDVGQTAQEE